MFEVKIVTHFSAAHFLREYKGKCESLHGHNWKVEVMASGEKLNSLGMIVDFGDLKKTVNQALDVFDHKLINDIDFFKKINPSSENIAKFIFEEISRMISGNQYQLTKIIVWETNTSCASYHL